MMRLRRASVIAALSLLAWAATARAEGDFLIAIGAVVAAVGAKPD